MFVGIDLAAEARNTAIAVLRDRGAQVAIEHVRVGADDDDIIAGIASAHKAGVDIPFGWPVRFTDLITAHAEALSSPQPDTGKEWRREILYRSTDLEVRRVVGKIPLSVAADRIAHPAIRWAGIAARLRDQRIAVPLDGSGIACEVYPAGALAAWGFGHVRYKGPKRAQNRRELVESLADRLPWLDWREHRAICADDDNALDAVISAIVAREVAGGRAVAPSPEFEEAAAQEGWIWLPAQDPS